MSDEERFARVALATLFIVVLITIISVAGLPVAWERCEDSCGGEGLRGVYFSRSRECVCVESETSK